MYRKDTKKDASLWLMLLCSGSLLIPWEQKKLSSEVEEGKVIEKLTRLTLKIINFFLFDAVVIRPIWYYLLILSDNFKDFHELSPFCFKKCPQK